MENKKEIARRVEEAAVDAGFWFARLGTEWIVGRGDTRSSVRYGSRADARRAMVMWYQEGL